MASKNPTKNQKLVRDSFTIPKAEYAVIDLLKTRAIALGTSVKKSELLRAGLTMLKGLNDGAFKSALAAVPTLKTGRPSAQGKGAAKASPPTPTAAIPAAPTAAKPVTPKASPLAKKTTVKAAAPKAEPKAAAKTLAKPAAKAAPRKPAQPTVKTPVKKAARKVAAQPAPQASGTVK